MTAIKRILAPVDFSEGSRAAIHYATALTSQLGASLAAIYVWKPPPLAAPETALSVPMRGTTKADLAEHGCQRAEVQMQALVDDIATEYPSMNVQGRVLVGEPGKVILEEAERGVDLIVMGTHGLTGLAHVLMGSVAEHVVRRAPCPVVTVRLPRLRRAALESEMGAAVTSPGFL